MTDAWDRATEQERAAAMERARELLIERMTDVLPTPSGEWAALWHHAPEYALAAAIRERDAAVRRATLLEAARHFETGWGDDPSDDQWTRKEIANELRQRAQQPADVAQRKERPVPTREVAGSNPAIGSIQPTSQSAPGMPRCSICKRVRWDGGHSLNDEECDETDGEVCRLHARIELEAEEQHNQIKLLADALESVHASIEADGKCWCPRSLLPSHTRACHDARAALRAAGREPR